MISCFAKLQWSRLFSLRSSSEIGKTAYQNITFDQNNKLVVDTSAGFKGGSAAARTQLLDAVNSTDNFNLKSVDASILLAGIRANDLMNGSWRQRL
jgi:hypothetical protein